MQTEVIYQNGFQEQYFLADSKGKIEIILANYISFQHQLSGIEDGIKLDIKVDQDFKFRQDKGDLGIRVQTVYSCGNVPSFRRNGYRCSGRSIPSDRNRIPPASFWLVRVYSLNAGSSPYTSLMDL